MRSSESAPHRSSSITRRIPAFSLNVCPHKPPDSPAACSSASGSGTTPLHWVARGLWSPDSSNAHARVDYMVEVAVLLVDAGARTDVPDSQGLVPRDYFERYLEGLVEDGEISAEEQSEALNRVPL